MVTEQEARDMNTAIETFKSDDARAQRQQVQADLATAQTWFDATIKPTLTWRSTQRVRQQFENTLNDRDTLEALTESDRFRQHIIRIEIEKLSERIRRIKERI